MQTALHQPGRKVLEGMGPLGLEPWEAQWLLQGGGASWASPREPVGGMAALASPEMWPQGCGPPKGHGHRDWLLQSPRGATSLAKHSACLSASCPGVSPGQVGQMQVPHAWLAWGLRCFLFYGSDNGHLAGLL